ncbi:MAG: FHA domain-containing protein [Oscillochloris sp.]|nr:FHA domain-containing protein [Oscillochloris sp.]
MSTPFEFEYQAVSRVEALREGVARPGELLLVDEVYVIGRSRHCHMVVKHPLVSRQHARLERDGDRYVLLDIGSANGTFVNSQPLAGAHTLCHGDTIGLGEAAPLLRFVDPDSTVRSAGRVSLNAAAGVFMIGTTPIQLPPVQFHLLLHLYEHRGEICSRAACAQAMWGHSYDPAIDAGAFDQAISSLRRILRAAAGASTDPIDVYRGRGYSLRA